MPGLITSTKRPPEDLLRPAESEMFCVNSWFYCQLPVFFWTDKLPVVIPSPLIRLVLNVSHLYLSCYVAGFEFCT